MQSPPSSSANKCTQTKITNDICKNITCNKILAQRAAAPQTRPCQHPPGAPCTNVDVREPFRGAFCLECSHKVQREKLRVDRERERRRKEGT